MMKAVWSKLLYKLIRNEIQNSRNVISLFF